MVGWQEMEGKSKVAFVVDKACENGRVRKEVERLYKNVWIESKTLTLVVLIIVLYGVNTLVFSHIIVYENDVQLKDYEVWSMNYNTQVRCTRQQFTVKLFSVVVIVDYGVYKWLLCINGTCIDVKIQAKLIKMQKVSKSSLRTAARSSKY